MATPGRTCSQTTWSTARTRSSRRSSVTMPCGRTCSKSPNAQQDVEFTVERHWVSGPTVLAAWHASYVDRADRARVRLAGFLTMEIAADGRIAQFREWWHRRVASAGA